MAKNFEFKPNVAGFVELRNSAALQALELSSAQKIADAAESNSYRNSSYTTDVQAGKSRAHARASTASRGAYWSAMKRKSLTSAIDAGRV